MKLPLLFVPAALAALCACTSQPNDSPADAGPPNAFGDGLSIRDVMDPNLPTAAANGAVVAITGVAYSWLDTYDETHDGKSVGTVYVQDAQSSLAYSGASLYEPSYSPASLRLSPGDIIDMPTATYVADSALSTVTFAPGQYLIQLSEPIITFRFDAFEPIAPTVINLTDLNDFNLGDQWLGMVVTINNVTFQSNLENADGRVTAYLTTTDAGIQGGTVELANELFDIATWNGTTADAGGGGGVIALGHTITSLTGIVTWFEGYQIAPRYPADIGPLAE